MFKSFASIHSGSIYRPLFQATGNGHLPSHCNSDCQPSDISTLLFASFMQRWDSFWWPLQSFFALLTVVQRPFFSLLLRSSYELPRTNLLCSSSYLMLLLHNFETVLFSRLSLRWFIYFASASISQFLVPHKFPFTLLLLSTSCLILFLTTITFLRSMLFFLLI